MGSTAPEKVSSFLVLRLSLIFGTLYFVQGITGPNDGLIAQPVRSLLKRWGQDPAEMTAFSALLTLPWAIKPLYGLLTDYVPIGGSRRRSYLALTSILAAASLLALGVLPLPTGAWQRLLLLLAVPTVAIAFADVVTDALMVENGQPLGITGRLQAVQWGASYLATILAAEIGGNLSELWEEHLGFLMCARVMLIPLLLALFIIREPAVERPPTHFREATRALWDSVRSPIILGTGAFFLLWNFNPFSGDILYLHQTEVLGFSELFTGRLTSLDAVASIAACVAYSFYCRRVPMTWLIHLSILFGVLSTLVFWFMKDSSLALGVTVIYGFTGMTAALVQLDLAARVCPVANAGTMFALLMSIMMVSTSASGWIGGIWFEAFTVMWGKERAFDVLVGVGAAFTAGCWLLVPYLNRHLIAAANVPRIPSDPPIG